MWPRSSHMRKYKIIHQTIDYKNVLKKLKTIYEVIIFTLMFRVALFPKLYRIIFAKSLYDTVHYEKQ